MLPKIFKNFSSRLGKKIKANIKPEKDIPESINGIPISKHNGSYIATNQLIIKKEDGQSIGTILNNLGIKKETPGLKIIPSNWDPNLFLVTGEAKTLEIIKTHGNNYKLAANRLVFADHQDASHGDGGEGTSTSGGMTRGDSGHGLKVGREKGNWREVTLAEELYISNNPLIARDDNRIQVGVIDFGWGDPHAETVKSAIERESVMLQCHDYSTVYRQNLVTEFSICEQIARGVVQSMNILNISLGYYDPIMPDDPSLLLEYIKNARNNGILIVCSAGNGSQDNDAYNHYPSSYTANAEVNNVISVSAVKYQLKAEHNYPFEKPAYANWGANTVDIYCPGNALYPSTAVVENFNDNFFIGLWCSIFGHSNIRTTRLKYAFGTSFSAATISGKIANLYNRNGINEYRIAGAATVNRDMIFRHLDPRQDIFNNANIRYIPDVDLNPHDYI